MATDRRSTPRVSGTCKVYGMTVPQGSPVTLIDISPGGMAIRTSVVLPTNVDHDFRMADDWASLALIGRVAHCERVENGQFTVGIQFAEAQADDVVEFIKR